jgi:hypothetical protein
MKYLIYVLLFSTSVFSQNYQYAIEEAQIEIPVAPTGVNNQLEEIEYFKAHLLPLAKKATLQQALDTHGSVRLEQGDYSGVAIVMKSNQRLYGHPSLTRVPNITILGGSSNVHLEDLKPAGVGGAITFQTGGVISDCTFKTIKYATLKGTNIMLENCLFIDFGGYLEFNCSQSGYFRNNKIIKHQAQSISPMLVMKGNSNTPSYGNVHLHTNFLTPHGVTTNIDGLQSSTFIGIDAEGWNLNGLSTKAMFSAQNMGNVKLVSVGGGNEYSAVRTPIANIGAKNLFWFNAFNSTPESVLSTNTNLFAINTGGDNEGKFIRKTGTITGFDAYGNLNNNNLFSYNGDEQKATLTNDIVINSLSKAILEEKYIPWVRPTWEILPDPLGPNWKAERVGKPDSSNFIQDLINTKKIAELPAGIFYIGRTLKLPVDSNHGIVGQGTGKTILVGLTDDFPLITLTAGENSNFTLSNLTLQGGNVGVYASQDFGASFITYQKIKFVVFRNQNYGIQLKQMKGFDNNFIENVGFVDCNIGFFQDALLTSNDIDYSSYIDKTMWYKCQFNNCKTGVYMVGTRANNMDAWVDCKFDGGQTALTLGGQNGPIVANCDFTNYTGNNVIISTTINMYNCNVFGNKITEHTIKSNYSNLEGCNFSDESKVFAAVMYNPTFQYILNSTFKGDIYVPTPSKLFKDSSAIYVNSIFLANAKLSKLLVKVSNTVPTILIDAVPNPYPQLLVTQ